MSKLYEALRSSSIPLRRESADTPAIRLGRLSSYEYTLNPSQLRTVGHAIEQAFPLRRGDCIGLTTIHGGNGAAVIARDYSISKAASGVKTLMIDADNDAMPLRWHFFGDQNVPTLASIDTEDWQASVCDELITNLDFMIAGESTTRLDEKPTRQIDNELLREIRREYDLSVFLFGNLANDKYLTKLSRRLDGLFIVTDHAENKELNEVGESLKAMGVPVMGAVIYA